MKSPARIRSRYAKSLRYLVIPALTAALVGCGGGGDDNNVVFTGTNSGTGTSGTGTGGTGGTSGSTGGSTGGTVPTINTRVFNIPSFSLNSKATLVANYQPPTEQSSVNARVVTTVEQSGLAGLGKLDLDRANRADPQTDVEAPVIRATCGTADVAALTNLMGEDEVRSQAAPTVLKRYQELPEGAQQNFYLITASKSVTAQKVLAPEETVHCTIFAELTPQGVPCLSRDEALYISRAFDTNNPFRSGSGIYDQVRAVFGSEWNMNPVGGIDGDTKVVLFFFRSATLGNSLYGYTSPIDQKRDSGSASNQAEIIYVNADKTDDQTLSTIAHEFQHLINQNQKTGRQGTFPSGAQNENITVNEGLSQIAEEVCGFTFDSGNDLLAVVSNDYLSRPEQHEFFNFDKAGLGYGQGYLFLRYVREQFGDATITAIATSPLVGLANLNAQLTPGFAETFRRWTIANYATNLSGSVPAIYRYPSGFRTDGNYAAGKLNGVRTFPLANNRTNESPTLGAWSTAYLVYQQGNGNNLKLTVETAPSSPIGLVYEALEGTFTSLEQ